jgi:diadenylate cyclase
VFFHLHEVGVDFPQIAERWRQLLARVQAIPWYEVVIELAVIWLVVYFVFRFLRGTRGARVIKGLALILVLGTLVIKTLTGENAFERLNVLYGNFLGLAAILIIVVFQPELRRALVRLGETRLFRQSGIRKARIVDQLLGAVAYLAKNKIGALIAIERQVGLRGIVEAGIALDAEITRELLNTIFWPGSALHDMGVIIRGDRIAAAGVQFPLAEGEQLGSELGSRHRAAIGLSQEADALIIVVSEETGTISLAERGQLIRNLDVERLRGLIARGIEKVTIVPVNGHSEGLSAGSDPAVAQTIPARGTASETQAT